MGIDYGDSRASEPILAHAKRRTLMTGTARAGSRGSSAKRSAPEDRHVHAGFRV